MKTKTRGKPDFVGRGHRRPGNTRTEIKSGPLGPTFFDQVQAAAAHAGESFTDYMRNAIRKRLEADTGRTFVPERIEK